MRLMTVVLSNGATLKMPTAAARTKPYIATQVCWAAACPVEVQWRSGRCRAQRRQPHMTAGAATLVRPCCAAEQPVCTQLAPKPEHSAGAPHQCTLPASPPLGFSWACSLHSNPPRIPTCTAPALQDLFQHNVWTVKAKGAEAAAASRVRTVDFSDFYKKFRIGGGDEDDAETGGGWENPGSRSGGSSGKLR
jgi:hypothetical protein